MCRASHFPCLFQSVIGDAKYARGNRFVEAFGREIPEEVRHVALLVTNLNIENTLLTWKQASFSTLA